MGRSEPVSRIAAASSPETAPERVRTPLPGTQMNACVTLQVDQTEVEETVANPVSTWTKGRTVQPDPGPRVGLRAGLGPQRPPQQRTGRLPVPAQLPSTALRAKVLSPIARTTAMTNLPGWNS